METVNSPKNKDIINFTKTLKGEYCYDIYILEPSLSSIFVKDKTTDKNLIFGTDEYSEYIKQNHIIFDKNNVRFIKARNNKDLEVQKSRAKGNAEVFTKASICNSQINLIDNEWFEKENVFNTENNFEWITNYKKINFNEEKNQSWEKYVCLKRMEIACGEAPYLTSRYNSVNGDYIKVCDRIGFLDRKLRIINENVDNEKDWFKWVKKALQSIYGYDLQGDNVILTRENLIYTTIDFFIHKFNYIPDNKMIINFAQIIVWNIWQMDGLNFTIPNSCTKNQDFKDDGVYCKIKDWENDKIIYYIDLINLEFDVIIANPPYQMSDGGGIGDSAIPLYNKFVEQAKKIEPKYISMIIPARWYSGGKGLSKFRKNMLTDKKLLSIYDFPETSDCFPGLNVRGGVCYFLWGKEYNGETLVVNNIKNTSNYLKRPLLEGNAETFIRYNNAISILRKIQKINEKTMDTVVLSRNPFNIPSNYSNYKTEKKGDVLRLYRNSRGNSKTSEKSYINRSYVTKNVDYIDKIKVLVSKASPGGDEYPHSIISTPIVAEKGSVSTETYLIVDFCENLNEANNLVTYMKSRFFRFMMALIKNTQNISKGVFGFVPIQDFKIEWTDETLYKKYDIKKEEIIFIESMIRPMD